MDIADYLRVLRASWRVVVGAVVVGMLGTLLFYGLIKQPPYTSCSGLFVTAEGGAAVGDVYQKSLFTQARTQDYVKLAESSQIANRTVDALGANLSGPQLQGKVDATAIPNTSQLTVCVSDGDAETARTLDSRVVSELRALVKELETSPQGGSAVASIDVVDTADLPTSRAKPSLFVRTLLGGVGGLGVGVVAAVALAIATGSVRRRQTVEEVVEGSVLGALPRDARRPEIPVIDPTRRSLLVESVQELATTLRFLGPGGLPQVLLVAGSTHGEGRTSVALDLGVTLAQEGARVVVVGSDLRDDALSKRLELSTEGGVSTVLNGEDDLSSVIVRDAVHGIAVVPTGPLPTNPAALLSSAALSDLLGALREEFDVVLLDSAPLADGGDTLAVAPLADGVLMLARLGKTRRQRLVGTLKSLDTVGARVLGAVVTFERGRHRA